MHIICVHLDSIQITLHEHPNAAKSSTNEQPLFAMTDKEQSKNSGFTPIHICLVQEYLIIFEQG